MAAPKILLVDDVKLFIELEKSFLTNSDVSILTAEDGEEALEIVRRERPDLVFLDLHMPKMNGVACCTAIKSDPDLLFIPVIMVTTAGHDEEIELCNKAGCDDYLTKPVERKAFLEKARSYLPDIERREPRLQLKTPALFRDGKGVCTAAVADISSGGIYLTTDYAVTQNDEMELAFFLSDSEVGLIAIKGRVAWLNSGKSRKKWDMPVGFGVEYTSISDEARQAIQEMIDNSEQEE
ncbi:response regulator [Geobacter sp. AOG1]|uniref:response regulator n=1 Tax=Geobacter sp. AOG1 TaxID=1566346 RepID=UPI001CC4B3C3|nr:response regulator [Geobacter sp. AOG1]GFE57612.1 two-component system response regulator [Geobacter sp. AOG1]